MKSQEAIRVAALLRTVPAQRLQVIGEADHPRQAAIAFTGRMTEDVRFGILTRPKDIALSDVRLFY